MPHDAVYRTGFELENEKGVLKAKIDINVSQRRSSNRSAIF